MNDDAPAIRVRARSLIGFAELVGKHGGDCNALLGKVGIATELLHTPEATFEHIRLLELFEHSAQVLELDDFGLRLAGMQGVALLGPIALMAQHAATVGEALEAIHRNIPYHSPGAQVQVCPARQADCEGASELACLRYELNLPISRLYRHNSELAYAVAVRFLQLVAPRQPEGLFIHFAHSKGLSARQYRRYLDCPVHLGKAFDALYFPKALLDLPIEAADPQLVETAQRYITHLIRRFPLDLAMQVETLLIRQLASGICTLPRIARQLSMSTRSLQRRLQAQDSSFDEIADRVRRQRAMEYLRQTDLPLAQVGSLLGYTESSTFNRSCQRWFERTPLAYRREV